ncbi:MAG: CRISPR-associated endonuclease Cas2 [Promethearchaeota archaeon]
MFWVITYDVPATHDDYRNKIASTLLDYHLFRIQYSVFIGWTSVNAINSCKFKIEKMLKKNNVPADIRFFPLCRECENKASRINSLNYKPGNKATSTIDPSFAIQ